MEKDKKYCRLYIVRHGQAQANVDKIVAGITDTPLTELGVTQACSRAEEFANIKFEAVFSSNLSRARRTAEIIAIDKKLLVNTTELLREKNFGVYEGKHEKFFFEENRLMFEKLEKLSEEEKRKFKVYPSLESEEEMMARFLLKLRELAVTYKGKNVLVVSHGSIMRTFLIHLFGPRQDFPWGSLANTAYIVVESDGVDFFLKNLVGHIKPKEF